MAVVLIMKMQYGFQIIMQYNAIFFAEIMAQLRYVVPRPEIGLDLG